MILFGADRLAADPRLLGPAARVALATNDAARLACDVRRSSRASLLEAGVPLVRLFSPEHGLGADAADGAAVADATDVLTRLPVVSLYGRQLGPPAESLADVDAVLFDMPDVGTRFYTYLWTLTHIIDACATAHVPVVVLDRPNPLGGAFAAVEGPNLDLTFASFIGRHAIPVRYALSVGELALLWQRERCPAAEVRVIRCVGWRRELQWHRTGLPFVPTSPALGSLEAVQLYGGICLFEATNLSVGRGCELSFHAIGAPWLDSRQVITRFERRAPACARLTAAHFTPTVGPHAGERCAAVRVHVSDAERLRPVALGIALLADVAATHPAEFQWAAYRTAANPSGAGHLERLLGTDTIRKAIEQAPQHVDQDMIRSWTAAPPDWPERCRAVLRYD